MTTHSLNERVPDIPSDEAKSSKSDSTETGSSPFSTRTSPQNLLDNSLSTKPLEASEINISRAEALDAISEFEVFLGRYLPYLAAKMSTAQDLSVASIHSVLPLAASSSGPLLELLSKYDASHYVWSVNVEALLSEQSRELRRFDEDTKLNDPCVRDAFYHRAIKSVDEYLVLQRAPWYVEQEMHGARVSFEGFATDSHYRLGTLELLRKKVDHEKFLDGARLIEMHDRFAAEHSDKLEVFLRENAFLLRPRDRRFERQES